MRETLTQLRYRWWPDHMVGELLSKPWMETAIPVLVLVAVVMGLANAVDGFFAIGQMDGMWRQFGEVGLLAMAMGLVIIVGGIDLSIGSIFALCNFIALLLVQLYQWPTTLATIATLLAGAALGAVNGLLIGYMRLRAFLTTLITLIVFRALYDVLGFKFGTDIAAKFPDSPSWEMLGSGNLLGIPISAVCCIVVAIAGHIFLTRLRPGWHVMAIGGSRRAAYNSGIVVARTVALSYVASGVMTAASAVFFASRLGTLGSDVGVGLEVMVLTAAVLGGVSLGGGRGSVTKIMVGMLTVLLVTNGLTAMSMSGGVTSVVLAATLLISVVIDIRWNKNRRKVIGAVYVSPTYVPLPPLADVSATSGNIWQVNNKLADVEIIGLDEVDGPEDVILDNRDNLYCGSRQGDIIRFLAPDYKKKEIFAHIGGTTLGLAFDRHGNLYVCAAGMGLYRVTPQGVVEKVTDETNRSWLSINDDSRMRLADDLDIAPDGRVFFSEATVRYEVSESLIDNLEGRGNGRIICWDPRDNSTRTVLSGLPFPNGVSIGPDGQSILFCLTTGCSVKRYWFDGPKTGEVETVLDNLPGFPDNINLASDGNYWLALIGLRGPALDLAFRMPGFRKRMVSRLPPDEWIVPQVNNGCVVKFTPDGRILETLWDDGAVNHPAITSMREHKGWLYLGGLHNNRIGRYRIPNADPNFNQNAARWGKDS